LDDCSAMIYYHI